MESIRCDITTRDTRGKFRCPNKILNLLVVSS